MPHTMNGVNMVKTEPRSHTPQWSNANKSSGIVERSQSPGTAKKYKPPYSRLFRPTTLGHYTENIARSEI